MYEVTFFSNLLRSNTRTLGLLSPSAAVLQADTSNESEGEEGEEEQDPSSDFGGGAGAADLATQEGGDEVRCACLLLGNGKSA